MVAEVLLPLPETEIDARTYDDQRGEVVSLYYFIYSIISYLFQLSIYLLTNISF